MTTAVTTAPTARHPGVPWVRLAVVALVSLLMVATAVAGRVSARLTGTEYVVRVAPVDPVDPFRGAYVALGYPDLTAVVGTEPSWSAGRAVYLPLLTGPDGVTTFGAPVTGAPSGPYLRCRDGWPLRCGIESWFVPQARAAAAQEALGDSTARARIRVDGRGNAAIVGLDLPSAG